MPLFAIHAITTRWQMLPLAASVQGGIFTLFTNGRLSLEGFFSFDSCTGAFFFFFVKDQN